MPNITPTFPAVIDASMRSAFVACPRQGFYQHILNLRREEPSIHLHFGKCVAAGLETARKAFWRDGRSATASVADAFMRVVTEWGDFDPPESVRNSSAGRTKTLDAALDAVGSYFERYPLASDAIQPFMIDGEPAVEMSFALPFGLSHPETHEPLLYAGRFDMIGRYNNAIVIVDEKTTTRLGEYWKSSWPLRGQLTGYCLTPDHEVLTPKGWIPVWQVTEDSLIAQWDDGIVSFVNPTKIFSPYYEGNLISVNGKISLTGTPDHRQPIYNVWNNSRKTLNLKDVAYSCNGSYRYYTSGQLISGKESNVNFVRLLVAIQADGSMTRPNLLRFSFTKNRKKKRLEWLLSELDIEFRKVDSGSRSDYYIKIDSSNYTSRGYALLGTDRIWGSWLLEFDNETLNAFINELRYWDGSDRATRGCLYFTESINNVEWVQTIAALTGHYSSVHTQHIKNHWKVAYRVNITDHPLVSVFGHTVVELPWNDKVYCVNVPSSYFLIRHNNKISVTGNCWGARSFGVNASGCIIRGIGILKGDITFEEAITARPDWHAEAWLRQLRRDVRTWLEMWQDMQMCHADAPHLAWDQAFDQACSAYGGCGYTELCDTSDPRRYYDDYVVSAWNPLERG